MVPIKHQFHTTSQWIFIWTHLKGQDQDMRNVELQIDLYLLLQVDDWSGIDKHLYRSKE